MQLSTERHYRGRVMAIVIATALGSTALGGPVVGAVADWLGPRWGVGIGGLSALIAVALGVHYLREKATT